MNFDAVVRRVGNLPCIKLPQARTLRRFLLTHRPTNCLELGFYHGVSTAHIAAALSELGRGNVVTIDRDDALELTPNIYELLWDLNLDSFVTVHTEPSCFSWRLKKLLDATVPATFDFCFVDGGHKWWTTGFAFCLVDRLLSPGGWIIFDDLTYTYDYQFAKTGETWIQDLPDDERKTPQVDDVFRLLVNRTEHYRCYRCDDWGYAQKLK